jgi:hypothetical protein
MNLLLSETLPLRTTRMLGDFAEDEVLPQRFGDLRHSRFRLIKLSLTEWFAADHPMPISNVYIDDEETDGWAQELRTDDAGNSWTVVVLAAAAPIGAEVSAGGMGRLNPNTGALIDNPAELMEYVLRLAGRTETFPQLRAEAAAAGIRLGGSLDKSQSIQSWLDEIAYSAGAIWTPGYARLYPTTTVSGPIIALDRLTAADLDIRESLQDTTDILRVSYDQDDVSGRPRHYIELTASPQRFGGVSTEVMLPWLRTPANAESIGRRILQRMSGVRYSVTLGTNLTTIRPGRWARLEAHPMWTLPGADPTIMVLGVEVTLDTREARWTGEVIASVPLITVTAHSLALPPDVSAAVEIQTSNGISVFTITDDNGKPLQGAQVSLDGGSAKTTDASGRVAFETTPGTHTLYVTAGGYEPFSLEVTV